MKKYTYLVNFDSQTLERVGESFAVKGDGGIAELEFVIPSNFEVPANQALWRVFFKLPGEKESLFETLPTVAATQSGDYVTAWVISKAITQKAGRLAFSLAAISGNDIQWNSRTVIMQVPESQYQPESEEAEEPYTGRLTALEGDMAAIRGEFGEVQEDFEDLKETATLGTPIPESLVANMQAGHVYIYTGTEPGYTAGHVYYYVDGVLKDGGVYGGTAVDATLTQSGQAADAKKTGDEISQIKEDLSDILSSNVDLNSYGVTEGYYVSGGSATLGTLRADTDSYASDFIKVTPNSRILFENIYLSGARAICVYDINQNVIGALATNSADTTAHIIIPNNGYFIRVTGSVYRGRFTAKYSSIALSALDGVDTAPLKTTYTQLSFTAVDGKFVSENGGMPNDTAGCATDYIRVRPYAKIIASGLRLIGARAVAGYDKNRIFVRKIISNTTNPHYTFTVDPDIYYIRATGNVGVLPTILMSDVAVDDTKRMYEDVSILIPYAHRSAVNRKIVTYVDDDALDEVGLNLLKESCDNLGIKCSIAAIGKILESTPTRVEYLKGLESQGFHICNHTYDHSRWYTDYDGQTMFTLAEVENDLIKSIRTLDNLGFIDASRYLIYPGSSYAREGITNIVKKWCEVGCTISAGNNRIQNVPRTWLYRCPINYNTHPDLVYYQTQLADLTVEGENNWIIYYSHSKTFDESGEWNQTLFEQVMQNAMDNGYTVMTLNEAWQYRKSMWMLQESFGR